jgi:hypothetical protein
VPTTRPRYTVADTGRIQETLDVAERRWPGVDRKDLLLRLTVVGRETVERDLRESVERRDEQRRAMDEVASLVDVDVLLSDAAWR